MDKILITADKNKIPTLQEAINQFDRICKAVQKGGLLLVDSLKYQIPPKTEIEGKKK